MVEGGEQRCGGTKVAVVVGVVLAAEGAAVKKIDQQAGEALEYRCRRERVSGKGVASSQQRHVERIQYI